MLLFIFKFYAFFLIFNVKFIILLFFTYLLVSKMNVREGLCGAVFERGYGIYYEKGFAVIGLSLGNSYFKNEKIQELVRFGVDNFSQVQLMILDCPAVHTYSALGYSLKVAEKKARLNGNTLRNHAKRAIASICDISVFPKVGIINWQEEIIQNEDYRREYQTLCSLYDINLDFRFAVRQTTQSVLEFKLKSNQNIDVAIDEGVNYLLKELAFLCASPDIFGVEKIAYMYHERWGVFENLVNGVYDCERGRLGFLVVK